MHPNMPETLSGGFPSAMEKNYDNKNGGTVADDSVESELPYKDRKKEGSQLALKDLGPRDDVLASICKSLIAEARVEIIR